MLKWQHSVSMALSMNPEFRATGESRSGERGAKVNVYEYHPEDALPGPTAGPSRAKEKAKAAKKGLNSVRMHGQAAGR